MKPQHPFEPTVVQIRRHGAIVRKTSRCRVCEKPGREVTTQRSGRTVTYWQHQSRPDVEPPTLDACDYRGTGNLWCCRTQGHSGGHHVHRGPRRNVGH